MSIKIEKSNTLPSGAIAVYTLTAPEVGQTVTVSWNDQEGTAIVVKTQPILGGQLHLVRLDVDWSSFDRSHDDGQ